MSDMGFVSQHTILTTMASSRSNDSNVKCMKNILLPNYYKMPSTTTVSGYDKQIPLFDIE